MPARSNGQGMAACHMIAWWDMADVNSIGVLYTTGVFQRMSMMERDDACIYLQMISIRSWLCLFHEKYSLLRSVDWDTFSAKDFAFA